VGLQQEPTLSKPPDRPPLRIPDTDDAETLLETFLEWVEELSLELYPAQEEAILEVFEGNHVILDTPTGSGKSLVAVAVHLRALARGERSFYTSPIKALVSEKFFDLCGVFGPEQVGMLTGDGAVNASAPLLCCTAEILSRMALAEGEEACTGHVVMDEFHYYSDRDRGSAWQIPLLILEQATFLLMSATLGNTDHIAGYIQELTDRPVSIVSNTDRPVPLEFTWADDALLETLSMLVARDKAPVYLVNFSQREASTLAQNLTSAALADSARRKAIRAEISGFRFDSPYGKGLRRILENGIGVHHAGLLPKYRLLVERLAQKGLLVVISGTDTLGVGVNVPIRTVLFTRLYKYDGQKDRLLSARQFKQIAGRAGRKGFDDEGWVVCQAPAHVIENRRREAKVASGKMPKKKFRREQPPKGYITYDEATFRKLIEAQPAPLKSSFKVDHGMLVELMQRDPARCGRDGGYGVLLDLIEDCHSRSGDKTKMRNEAEQLLRSLVDAGLVIEDEPGQLLDGPLRLSPDLQENFSVFQSLALFVLDALEYLDPKDLGYAPRVMTLVESIQENPRAILGSQRYRARGEKVAELKAEGMDYADRMDALEDVTYPKPDAEWLYLIFNKYLEGRPWLSSESVRPKSIAREMFETWSTFHEYVRELRLEAIEGVLLRYLSQVYKVLSRSIPESFRTDDLVDATAFLRATVAHADSSLVTEWEKLLDPEAQATAHGPARPADISRNPRTFQARVRAELHHLVRSLSKKAWDDATACVRDPEGAWTASAFEEVLEPFFEEHGPPRFDHAARLTDKTTIRPAGDHQWEVSQALIDAEGELTWFIEGEVDLRVNTNPEGPLVQLVRIGA
jgi:superfamily II RNA helicase